MRAKSGITRHGDRNARASGISTRPDRGARPRAGNAPAVPRRETRDLNVRPPSRQGANDREGRTSRWARTSGRVERWSAGAWTCERRGNGVSWDAASRPTSAAGVEPARLRANPHTVANRCAQSAARRRRRDPNFHPHRGRGPGSAKRRRGAACSTTEGKAPKPPATPRSVDHWATPSSLRDST